MCMIRVRANFKSQWIDQLRAMAVVLMMLSTVTCLIVGCGKRQVLADEPKTIVFVISDQLEGDLANAVREVLLHETNWLKDKAPVGAKRLFVNGYSGELIARLEATPGVPRLRGQQLTQPFNKVMSFAKSKSDETNRLNVPKVIRDTLPSLNLPSQSTVVFIGSPLHVDSKEKDSFFSMTDGFIPGDGLLLESWLSSIYSTQELKVPTKLWFHWLIPPSMANFQPLKESTKGIAAFESAPHQTRVIHFWAKYLGASQGTLVTAQSGAEVLAEQLRNNVPLSALFNDVSIDSEGSHLMVKRVIVDGKEVERIERTRQGIKTQTKRDIFGNPIGAGQGLHGDKQLRGRVALLLLAEKEELSEALKSPALAAIKGRLTNQSLTIIQDFANASQLDHVLADHDQIWIWSGGSPRLTHAMVDSIVKRFNNGASLLLLADNEPHVGGAREVLQAIVPGSDIRGDYEGKQILSRERGELPSHEVLSGIDMLFEGDSISHVVGDLIPVVRSSDNQVLIAERKSRDGKGKLLVYCGFTAMYERYFRKVAGSDRLITNFVAYLSSEASE